METNNTCDEYCLFDLYDSCVDNNQCNSFSYNMQTQGETYRGWQYKDSPGNYIMLRRNNISNYKEFTTTTSTYIASTTDSSTSTSGTQTSVTTTTFSSVTDTSTSKTQTSATATSTFSSVTDTSTSKTQTSTSSSNTDTLSSSSMTDKLTIAITTSSTTDTFITDKQTSATATTVMPTDTATVTTITSSSNTDTSTSYTQTFGNITSNLENSSSQVIKTFTTPMTNQKKSLSNNSMDANDRNSSSGIYTTMYPSKTKNNSDHVNTVLYILISLFVVILVGFTIIGYVIYRRKS